ncbi:MAG TPA: DUF1697 domain-containing protein, partial [Acidimicrobiales bacterium]|nr:DUF1697 domain-containing protein [Acidimicrobiales bacterium]
SGPLTRYVALLRGVNVGGANRLAMADLRALVEGLGFERVETFIQSGNVLFDAPGRVDPARLEQALADRSGLAVDVLVRSSAQLAAVLDANPFAGRDPATLHVAFLAQPLAASVEAGLERDRFLPEEFALAAGELYLCLPKGMGRAKLPAYLGRALGVPMTVRNWRTVCRLAELSARPESGPGG